MADYSKQLDRIIELLEEERGIPNETGRSSRAREDSTRPRHSGHKGGDFMRQAREAFKHRFDGLDWKSVNKWITTVYGIASRAVKEDPDASEADLLWLYEVLRVSLENGFAQALSEKPD